MTATAFTDLIRRVGAWIDASGPGGRECGEKPTATSWRALVQEVFAAQYEEVAPYRALCQARGVRPEALAVTDGREIPAVPTASFKDLEFTSLPVAERMRAFLSSGTTGQARSRHFHSPESLALYERSVCAGFGPALLPEWGQEPVRWRFAVLTPSAEASPGSSLAHMFSTVVAAYGAGEGVFLAEEDGAGDWRLDGERALAVLREAEREGRPVVILGTAFGWVHLLEHLEAEQAVVSLPRGSRGLETGGYKGRSREVPKAELHGWIQDRLGLPASGLICEYGMSELSSQAYDGVVPWEAAGRMPAAQGVEESGWVPAPQGGRRVFRFPAWARAWVVSPEDGREVKDGEVGLLRVLDLANVRSVMAVQTEDLAVRHGGGFEWWGRLPAAEMRGCSLRAR